MSSPTGHGTTTYADRLYNVFLGVFTALLAMTVIMVWGLMDAPTTAPDSLWSFAITRNLTLAVALFCAAVLAIRIFFPTHRKGVTLVLNVLLL
ncbi:MAG TPA: hypothetical protein VMD30_11290, partial [Tepidisphaeraceae bacterium]|nr:hypothetical protein [Tepidisphaeraceae bacterium]